MQLTTVITDNLHLFCVHYCVCVCVCVFVPVLPVLIQRYADNIWSERRW